MKYLAALVFPPLALLLIGKPGHFVLNASIWIISIPLTVMFAVGIFLWMGCVAHAFIMCIEHDQEKHERLAHHEDLHHVDMTHLIKH